MRRVLIALAALAAGSTSAAGAVAAPPVPAAAAQSGAAVPEDALYAPWARVLSRYVDAEGLVDYAGLKEHGAADLKAFTDAIARVDPEAFAGDLERKAFWINAYNAVVVAQVVEGYPIDSVRDVGFFGGLIGGFFKQKHRVAGRDMSADDIEHGTLRARWPQDAEIHWTLVCAAFGCPRLLPRPYRASDLDATLQAQAREFLSLPRGLQLDRAANRLYVSSYFKWYGEDFERVAGGVLDYVLRFAPQEVAAYVAAHRDQITVAIMPYDWTLNDQKHGPRSRRPVERE